MTAAGKGIERLREAAEKLLKAYQSYYSINREKPADPFYAEAEFRNARPFLTWICRNFRNRTEAASSAGTSGCP